MPDDRPLHEVLLEYAFYVPIGLAASVAEQLPELTAKGRRLAGTRIHLARLMGEFAVGHAQRRIGQVFSSNGAGAGRADETSGPAPGPPGRHGPDSVSGAVDSPDGSAPDTTPVAVGTETTEEPPQQGSPDAAPASPRKQGRLRRPTSQHADGGGAATDTHHPDARSVPAVESLAIPAYDTLAASQVVQRLSSLEPDELEAVRRYEIGTRGRRTILHRVAQLNAAGGRPTF